MANWSNGDGGKPQPDSAKYYFYFGLVIVAIMFLVYALSSGGWWL